MATATAGLAKAKVLDKIKPHAEAIRDAARELNKSCRNLM